MKNLILSALLGGVAIFIWGFIFWVMLPSDQYAYKLSQNDRQLISFMEQRYDIPSTHVSYLSEQETPIVATVFLQRSNGYASMLWQGLIFMIIAAGCLAVAIRLIPVLPSSYFKRVMLISVIGIAATVLANLGDPIWFTQGWGWHLVQAAYDLSCWVVAALVLAAFIKPPHVSSA